MKPGIIIFIILLSLFTYAGFYVIQLIQKKRKVIESYKNSYENALKSGDKSAALIAGRKYYSMLRGGVLSTYDEQAIANDLSAMKSTWLQNKNRRQWS